MSGSEATVDTTEGVRSEEEVQKEQNTSDLKEVSVRADRNCLGMACKRVAVPCEKHQPLFTPHSVREDTSRGSMSMWVCDMFFLCVMSVRALKNGFPNQVVRVFALVSLLRTSKAY